MYRALKGREAGLSCPAAAALLLRRKLLGRGSAGSVGGRSSSDLLPPLALHPLKEVAPAHRAGVNTLQVDLTEGRWLLAGASDASVALYDLEVPSRREAGVAIHTATAQVERAHAYAVSCAAWYPVDTGLFVTGSFDGTVGVWDANSLEKAASFNLGSKVYAMALSACASSHSLVATGASETRVRLIDIVSGADTHALAGGHRDGVLALTWDRTREWRLYSGGKDGTLAAWDVRSPGGPVVVFDQHRTHTSIRTPARSRLRSSSSGKRGKQVDRDLGGGGGGRPETPNWAQAHDGAITAIATTPEGQRLLSMGTDSRARLWDVETGSHYIVHYPNTRSRASKGSQMAVSSDGRVACMPGGTTVGIYDVATGEELTRLRGHLEEVSCCCFQLNDTELYTTGNDRQILVWAPPIPTGILEDVLADAGENAARDVDTWSDNER
eukprot:jgi/Chlat1/7372/Chrsp6S07413